MVKKENLVFLLFSIVSISIGILTTYLVSNYLTIEDFGRLQFLLTLVGIGTIFYMSGFDIVIQKQIFDKNDEVVEYILKNVMPFSFILLIFIFSIYYTFIEKNSELLLYATIIVSIGLFDKSNAILNSKLMFKQLRYLELYSKLLLLSLASAAVIFKYTLLTYMVLFSLTSVLIIIVRIFYTKRQLILKDNNIDYENIKDEGIKTTISTSYAILSNWSEKLVLGMLDSNLLAIFVIGQLFPKVIKDNVKILLIPTLNTLASKGFDYYKSMINKYELTLWVFGIIIYTIFYFMVDIIISNFFSKYEESILIAQLLSVTLIFKFVENIKMSSMALSKHTNIFNKINNMSNTLKIVLVLILVNMYGVYGAIASILIVEIFRFVLITKEFIKL
jgi:O-antigen/teichoic acid export membrane protein